jgi:hypothetical protein
MTQTPESYQIQIIPDNILRITEHSKPNEESSTNMTQAVLDIVKQHPVNKALIDLSSVSILPSSRTRKNIANMLATAGFKQVAVFGPSISIRVVAEFILHASGLKQVKFFPDEAMARAWLTQ